jgi:predicted nucleotidyltransferase
MFTPIMGMKAGGRRQAADASAGLADALFSKTKQRVLGVLFGNPGRSFYVSEILSRARGGTGTVLRELARLEKSGLVNARRVGNQRHYQANADSPLFDELRSIVDKTVGLAGPLGAALRPLAGKIHAAFIFGSVARKTDTARSDIDLLILSDHLTYGDVYSALESAGAALGRQVNPTIYSMKDFRKRRADRNPFLMKILGLPKLWVIGTEDELAA